jgi:hypothetical protein
MSQLILHKVQGYLTELNHGNSSTLNSDNVLAFSLDAGYAFEKALLPRKDREFRLRMSNLGRPGCVLTAEKLRMPRDPVPYSDTVRNAYGDLVEALALAIMKQAGVNIVSVRKPVALEVAGEMIDGTYDVVIAEPEPKMYDIKSASSFVFNNKYKDHNLKNLWDDGDGFGYVTQLYSYARAKGIPVGGLIVINKENGEWCLVEPPIDETEIKQLAFKRASDNVLRSTTNAPFRRDFTDIEETFRKKKTGNRILGTACSFCPYKNACWPGVVHTKDLVSKGQNPRYKYYTFISEEFKKNNND